jgi:outer membrane protein
VWKDGRRCLGIEEAFQMKKGFSFKKLVSPFPVFALCGLFFIGGCSYVNDWYEPSPEFFVPQEEVRQIDVIDLEEAAEEKPDTVDVVEPEISELELSLEECRALALENNLDLRVQLINPSIAREGISQEEAKFDATFTGNVNYAKTDTPTASTLDIAGSRVDSASIDLGVSIPLRTGGTLSFDIADRRTKTDSLWSVFNPSYDSDFSASISQPLLRNSGNRVNTHSIRVAQYNSSITDARTKLEAIRIIANVDRAYWRLYATRKLLDVRKKQYDLSNALYEETSRFVEVGEKPKIEMIRTEVSVADKLEAIIKAENEVRDTERDLKRMLNKKGLAMETNTVLIPSSPPDPVRYELDRNRMVEKALENRMEMLELELQIAQDSSNIDFLKNQTLPLVTLEYKYNINGLGPEIGDSYDMLSDNEFNDHRFGLQVSIPIGNREAKSRLRKAMYERAQRLASRENKKSEIKYEVLNQIDKLEANWQRILASRQTTILQNEQYRAEKRQFEVGLVTSTDVLNAQTDLADAQRLEILALAEYQIALIDLAYATGTLLGAAKVEWDPVVPRE